MTNANDNDPRPFIEGERVQMRGQPWLQGTVWSIEHDMIIIAWDDEDENAYIRKPQRLQRIIRPQPESHPASAAHLRPV